jgi:general secretion pathway protein G
VHLIFEVQGKKRTDAMSSYSLMGGRPVESKVRRMRGFTLIELIIVVFIVSTLAGIAFIAHDHYIYKAQISKASADIRDIEAKLLSYCADNGIFPPTLAEVGEDSRRDPWNRPYEYWPITGDPKQKVRKDRNLHPLNTDFDLGSRGKDGATNFALTAGASRDDIIRANNGAFVGLASNY